MAKLRKPFYMDRKHVIMKCISSLIAMIYLISILIGIYMTSFGRPVVEPQTIKNDVGSQESHNLITPVLQGLITNEVTSEDEPSSLIFASK